MSAKTTIEWTDATWNPVRGCTQISPGCKNCYAKTFAERWRGIPGHSYERGFDIRIVPEALELPYRWKKPRRVFVNSMSDLFHDEVPHEFIEQVFVVMRKCPQHQFQILTKRPERMVQFGRSLNWAPNILAGVSVENAAYKWRIDLLRATQTMIRFLSCEPLLGPLGELDLDRIGWVIVGGESGPRSRPMDKSWVTEIRDQCVKKGVPFFFKQWGGTQKHRTGRTLEGQTWDEMPAAPVAIG